MKSNATITFVLAILLCISVFPILASAQGVIGNDTGLTGDDKSVNNLPIGFTFTYWGVAYTTFGVSTNGWMSLQNTAAGTPYTNPDFPLSDSFDGLLAPFFDDIRLDNPEDPDQPDGKVFYLTIGETPNRRLIIQYHDVYFYGTNLPMGTFEIILYENANRIAFQYRYLRDERSFGNSATIGLDKVGSDEYVRYSFNTDSLGEQQAVLFTPDGQGSYTMDSRAPYAWIDISGLTNLPPQDGGEYASSSITFTWEPTQGANAYRIDIATAIDESAIIASFELGNVTSFSYANDLTEGTTYYARVAASLNNGGTYQNPSLFSDGITIDQTPPSVHTPTGEQGPEETIIDFHFSGTDNYVISAYHIQIAPDTLFTDPFVDTTINTQEYSYQGSLGQTLYVRAYAIDAAGNQSAYSDVAGPFIIGGVEADFSAHPVTGSAPLPVQFSDQSTGNPISWQWDFTNDGMIDATSQHPSFTYTTPGVYAVKLIAGNAYTSDELVKTAYIEVIEPVVVAFSASPTAGTVPLTVQFTDESTGGPTSWQWDFDHDGAIDATDQHPSFTYTTPGRYAVKLIAANADSTDTDVKYSFITALAPIDPVSGIQIHQTDADFPIVTWTYPNNDAAGYNIYVGSDDALFKLNQMMLTERSYQDRGYTGDKRRYTVMAVDMYGGESVGRSLTLPMISAAPDQGTTIKRNIINHLNYTVQNHSAHRLEHLRLTVEIEGQTHTSEEFDLEAGASQAIPVTVVGHADLPDIAPATATVEIVPNSDDTIHVVRHAELEVTGGIPVLGLLTEDFLRGGTGRVRFTLENPGEEPIEMITARNSGNNPSDEMTFFLLDGEENILSTATFKQAIGEHVFTLADGTTVARIPAGATFVSEPAEIAVPLDAPRNVTLELEIEHFHYQTGQADHAALNGSSVRQPLALVETSYYGELVSITPETSNGDQDIAISGRSIERSSGQPLAEAPLNLFISVNGFERKYQVFTDENGEFTHTFSPLPEESGIYTVWARHPDLTDKAVQGQFVISRVFVDPLTINMDIPRNYEQEITIRAKAGNDTEAHHGRIVYEAAEQTGGVFPQGIHVTPDEPVDILSSERSADLKCTIWADNTADETGKIVLKVQSDETAPDAWAAVVVNMHFTQAEPALFFTPDHLETGVAIGESVTETIELENRGLAALEDVSLTLVQEDGTAAPDWVHLDSPAQVDALAVGETRDVSLTFTPTASEGEHSFYLRVNSSNYPQTDILLFAAVTQAGEGNAQFKVEDIYTDTTDPDTGELIQGLAGATITVQNEEVLTLEQSQTTDEAGEAIFSNLPVGRYKYRVRADNHQEKIGRLWIKPGVTMYEDVFLEYNLVTVEWEVTETTIEDEYEIVLDATYETDVPAPVVVAEPASITLPPMKAGDVYYGEYTLTNYGLIRADNVDFVLPPDDEFFTYELLAGMPTSLAAKERVTVPYRVICLLSPDLSEQDASGSGCVRYLKCIKTTYEFECSNGTRTSSSTVHCVHYNNGECIGDSSTGFSGGGSGGSGWYGWGGGSGGTSSPAPKPKPISGVVCWPVAVKQDVICQERIPTLTEIFQNAIFYAGCTVNTVFREYNDEATDLSVKVPGGSVDIRRRFYGNEWHWGHIGNTLHFVQDSLGQGLESIEKRGVIYEKSGNGIYVYDTYKIKAQETGYRWEDKFGNWQEYDLQGQMISYGTPNGRIAKLLYEAGDNGKLIGLADRNDRQVIWFEYDGDSQLSTVSDLANRRVEYSYTNGYLTQVLDVLGQPTTYQYDDKGRTIKTVDAGGRATFISYDQYGNVSQVVDQDGNGHFFQYNYDETKKEYYAQIKLSSGMVREVWYNRDGETKRVDINGRTVQTIEQDGRNLIITDEKGNVTRKYYDEWDNLIKIIYPDGSTVTFEYEHTFNRITKKIDQRGNVTQYQYDGNGNVTQKNEAGRITIHTYNEYGQVLTSTKEGATIIYIYDSNGNVTTITDPEGHAIRFSQYDVVGNPQQMLDARGNSTIFTHDKLGRFISQTDPSGNTTTFQYSAANNRIGVTNPLQSFAFEYDDHNNLTKVTTPSGPIIIEYNTDNLPVHRIDQEGNESFREYDNEGRLKKVIDGAGNEIVYHYDESQTTTVTSDKPVQIDYPTYSRKFFYDVLQRLVREENNGDVRSYLYDAAGNQTSVTDEDGNTTRYEYNAFNQPVKITDAAGGITEMTYDNRGNLTAVKDPNSGTTRYEYDMNNRLIKAIRPMGQETVYEYDANGNCTKIVDANGQVMAYQYDALNRLIKADYSGSGISKTIDFSYNALGKLTSYNDRETSAAYTYDNMLRKLSKTVNYGPFSLNYAYTYYANGLKQSFTGADGVTYDYAYDTNNRLTGITVPEQGQITYSSYQWNSPTRITLPGGLTFDYSYDPLRRLEAITAKSPNQNILLSQSYQYSPVGNITAKSTEHGDYTYQYDHAYRLTQATNPVMADEAYTYDLVYNRLTSSATSGAWTYNQNNELLSYDNVAFKYDNTGNMTRKTEGGQATDYIYGAANRLVRVADGGGSALAEYGYDPFGRRLWKDVGGVKTYFFYSDEGLIGEYDANGQAVKTYGYIPDSLWSTNPLFQKIGTSYYWYQNDYQWKPQQLIDSGGHIVWSTNYDSFGNTQIGVNTIENNFRLPGQYYDAETGLHYNLNRYYDPISGRYLRIDPFGQGLNLYVYAFGNPLNWADPEGLCLLQTAGGVTEMTAGVTLTAFGVSTGWTGVGILAVGGGVLVTAHGADQVQAGFRSIIEGREVDTYTSQWISGRLQQTGMSEDTADETAEWIDTGISVVGTAGGKAVTATTKKATQALVDEMIEEGLENRRDKIFFDAYGQEPASTSCNPY